MNLFIITIISFAIAYIALRDCNGHRVLAVSGPLYLLNYGCQIVFVVPKRYPDRSVQNLVMEYFHPGMPFCCAI